MIYFHILFVIKTPSRGRKDPLKFASLPTSGFVAQLVERPTSIWEARVQAPSKPEFFFSYIICNKIIIIQNFQEVIVERQRA